MIALALSISFFTDQSLIGHYLFLAKFPEAFGGVIVALAPILYKYFEKKISISIFNLFRDKLFLLFLSMLTILSMRMKGFISIF